MKTEMIETINDDPVREATRRRVEAERAVERIEEELKSFNVQPGRLAPTLRLLKLQEDHADALNTSSLERTEEERVKRAARARIIADRQPRRTELLVRLLAQAEALLATADEVRRHDEATPFLVRHLPGDPLPVSPLPALATVREQLATLRRSLAPPAPSATAPGPEPGHIRVRLLYDSYFDEPAGLVRRARGDVFDVAEREGRRMTKNREAVEVEVGA